MLRPYRLCPIHHNTCTCTHTPQAGVGAGAARQVYRHLVALEALHLLPEMSALASVEAVCGSALEYC